MPARCFTCRSCGRIIEAIQGLFDDCLPACECGGETRRSYAAESDQSRPTKIFQTPIEMFSVGMHPDEVPAFRRANPEIEVHGGVPLAKTRQEKKRVLKYFNFEEHS